MVITKARRRAIPAGLFLALAVGCSGGADTGDVFGTVTVDGKAPMAGSSITFIPAGGKGGTAGATLDHGKYSATVPIGLAKVEIRVPRIVGKAKPDPTGYQTQGDTIEETLPAKYNDATELTYDVKVGKNEKNWDLTTHAKKK